MKIEFMKREWGREKEGERKRERESWDQVYYVDKTKHLEALSCILLEVCEQALMAGALWFPVRIHHSSLSNWSSPGSDIGVNQIRADQSESWRCLQSTSACLADIYRSCSQFESLSDVKPLRPCNWHALQALCCVWIWLFPVRSILCTLCLVYKCNELSHIAGSTQRD